VDFVCLERHFIVEVDGGQHLEQMAADDVRTGWLMSEGYRVLRFWNHDVLQRTDTVVEAIADAIQRTPPP
jgi:very-short-patch-repair endonuclease